MLLRAVKVSCFKTTSLTEQAKSILYWMKDFDLMITADGQNFIGPEIDGTRNFIRENHLRCMIRRDVEATKTGIESFIIVIKEGVKQLAKKPEMNEYVEEVEVL